MQTTTDPAIVTVNTEVSRYPHRWLAATVLMIGSLVDLIDGTVVNVALPTIRTDTHATATQLEWIVSAYLLAFAATLICAGSFGDLYGRKRVFLLGTALFGIASLCAGLAQSPDELIAARVVQGAAAAAMTPQVLATLRAMFAGKERGTAFGMFGAIMGFASAVGLLLGGVLTDANLFGWGWRAIFFVNVPIALGSLVATAALVPETREPSARRPDLAGAALLTAALVAIVFPLLEGRAQGWPAWIWGLLVAGVALLGALAFVEGHRRSQTTAPLLRPGLLRIPSFGAGIALQVVFAAGLQGVFVTFALWLQLGQHYSPLRAGLTTVAFSAGGFLGAPVAIPLALRFGRLVLIGGALLLAVGTAAIDLGAHHVGAGTGPWPLVPGLVISGLGLVLVVIPLVNVVLAAVPARAAGGASGLFNTAEQLGGAIGVALVGTIFFGYLGTHSYRAAFDHTVPYLVGAFLVSGILCLALPRTALGEEAALEID